MALTIAHEMGVMYNNHGYDRYQQSQTYFDNNWLLEYLPN